MARRSRLRNLVTWLVLGGSVGAGLVFVVAHVATDSDGARVAFVGSLGATGGVLPGGETAAPGTLVVVRPWRRLTMPVMPACRMSRSTRLRPTLTPSVIRSSAWILGDP